MGLRSVTPSSSNSLTTHVTSEAAWDMALYLASELDLETVCCFFDLQQIGDRPNNKR